MLGKVLVNNEYVVLVQQTMIGNVLCTMMRHVLVKTKCDMSVNHDRGSAGKP